MRTLPSAVGLMLGAAALLAGCSGATTNNINAPAPAPAVAGAPSQGAPAPPPSHLPVAHQPTPSPSPPTTRTPAPAPPPPPPTTSPAAPAPAAPAPAAPAPAAPAPAAPAPAAPVPAPAAPLVNADAVVTQYYQDISDHDYAAAWALGGANIAGESYADYVAGFATTAAISLGTISNFGSDQVTAVLYATQTDGSVKVFTGTYTVSGGVLVGASIVQE